LALHDQIRWLRQDGFHVTVEVAGSADKHAILILQAANKRLMTKRSWLDIQEVAFGEWDGSTFLSENELAWMQQLEAQQRGILMERSILTESQIKARIRLKTHRVSAQEALNLGLIDEISAARTKRDVAAIPCKVCDLPEPTTAKQRKSVAEIRKMRAEAELQKLKDRERESSAAHNGVVRFINEVDTDTVAQAKADLAEALKLSPSPIELLIDSNGGSCTDGFGFIDICEQTANSGRELNTRARLRCLHGWCHAASRQETHNGQKRLASHSQSEQLVRRWHQQGEA
jgi:ATP-dependent protease ClpP protease subunit